MIKLTTLDDCPDNPCQFERDAKGQYIQMLRCCKFHQQKIDSGMTGEEIYKEILINGRARDEARYKIKMSLGLDKEHPGIPFKLEDDGTFTLGIDQKDNKMEGWPDEKVDLSMFVDKSTMRIA